jgi:hypothetical protein
VKPRRKKKQDGGDGDRTQNKVKQRNVKMDLFQEFREFNEDFT